MKKTFDLSAAALHILAMAFMLLDHLWATLFLSQEWMTCVGRLAFPIFALDRKSTRLNSSHVI